MSSRIEFDFPDDAALPTIPIILSRSDRSISVNALLDSGATVNVLPYEMGIQLGAIWEEQTILLPLARNLAKVEARGLFLNVRVGNLEAVRLAFAWTNSSQVPLILGQTNFFQEFDVCFQRSRCTIDISRLPPVGFANEQTQQHFDRVFNFSRSIIVAQILSGCHYKLISTSSKESYLI